MKQPTSKSFDRTSSPDEVKNKLPMEAPRDKQRLVISIIGWIIELIVRSLRNRKSPQPPSKGESRTAADSSTV